MYRKNNINLKHDAVLEVVKDVMGLDPLKNTNKRLREYVEVRQMSMLFLNRYTCKNLTAIGRVFKGKRKKHLHHATVLHGIKQMSGLISFDKRLKDFYTQIDLKIKKIIPDIKEDPERTLFEELEYVNTINQNLETENKHLWEMLESLPDDLKDKYFKKNDGYIYNFEQENNRVGVVSELEHCQTIYSPTPEGELQG